MKIFQQTFLAGGLGFNIDDLALKKDENGQFVYIWLIAELLNSESLPSLAGYVNLRNQIKVFSETEVLPLILRECCSESGETLFIALIKYLTENSIEKSSLYSNTLGNIVKLIVSPPEGLYELVADFKNWKELIEITIENNIDMVISADNSNDPKVRRILEMIKVISDNVKRLLYTTESYQNIIKKVIDNLDLSKESNIILFTTMIDENKVDVASQISEDEKIIRETEHRIMLHTCSLIDQKVTTPAGLDSILQSLNLSIKRYSLSKIFDDFEITSDSISKFLINSLNYLIDEEAVNEDQEEVKEDIQETNEKNAILFNILFLQFTKRTISSIHQSNSESTYTIINKVLEYSKVKAEAFDFKMNLLKQTIKQTQSGNKNDNIIAIDELVAGKTDYETQIQEHEFELIECIGDVITSIIPYMHENIDEDILYSLLNTQIENIQKATYLALVYFYENFVPPLK